MKSICKSVVGMCRKNNEDSVFCGENGFFDLFIVADGMGGCNGGEVASSQAIEAFLDSLRDNNDFISDENVLDALVSALQHSNEVVYRKSCEVPELAGMGTTIDAVVIRNGSLKRITDDHSFVMELVRMGKLTEAEAEVHPGRNIITRALGTRDTIEIDTVIKDVQPKDIILLCTDGLTTMIDDKRIEEILCYEKSIEEKLDILVNEANNAGGYDNITIILVEQEVEE